MTTGGADGEMRAAALAYAERLGWPVLPLHTVRDGKCTCGQTGCKSPGKHPLGRLVPHGLQEATTDPQKIQRWWTDTPDANIGVATGAAGLLVVDVDPGHGGGLSLAALEAEYDALPETAETTTGGGGRHVMFRLNGAAIRNSAGRLGDGLDIRGDGGYIVMPPSLHVSGRRYAWAAGRRPSEVGIAAPPEWLVELLSARQTAAAPPIGETIPEGRRNTTLTSLAGSLRRRGGSLATIEAALVAENRQKCNPPLPVEEVRRIARSVVRYPPKQPDQSFPRTDYGLAERLIFRHGEDLRYCYSWGSWMVWDKCRWARDEDGEARRRMKETVRSIYREAAEACDANRRESLVAFARACESERRITAGLKLAESEAPVAITAAVLDADPWVLNVLNGTIDLRTGKLRPHRREDLLSKLAPVEYNPDARLDLWDQFLHETTGGDEDYAAFLARAAGYSCTGDCGEEKLFMALGAAATGKSTFLEALRGALGDYAATADFETFLAKHNSGGPRNDIARLVGRRFVVSIEVDEGKRLAEGLVKMLSGGDTVAARFLYKESFEFRPQFKLWLAANHAPAVDDRDAAMWRRILRLPFDHVVPESQRDPTVKAQLRDPAIGGPAVLAWMVWGCIEWQRIGLAPPDCVLTATAAYKDEMDPLKDFLEDRTIETAELSVARSDLRQAYEQWCAANGEKPLSSTKMNARLRDRFKESWMGNRRAWRGLGLQAQAAQEGYP